MVNTKQPEGSRSSDSLRVLGDWGKQPDRVTNIKACSIATE